jgi:hypothetical protein
MAILSVFSVDTEHGTEGNEEKKGITAIWWPVKNAPPNPQQKSPELTGQPRREPGLAFVSFVTFGANR